MCIAVTDLFDIFSGVIAAFMKSESHQNCRQEVIKVTERLVKVLNEAEICVLVERMTQKNGSELYVSIVAFASMVC